jgi:pimeloyl-ACP methyl ester carboxylesterase
MARQADLAWQTGGPTDAPPLLLLQGQANSHHWWNDLREAFERDFHTVTFDYRGTGDSAATGSGWSTASFADDAVAVLDRLGVDRAHVYGTSMGGRVAQMFAVRHPERLQRLVLACTSPGGPHAHERGQDVRRALAQPDATARREALIDLMCTPAWRHRGKRSNLLGDPTMTAGHSREHLRVSAAHDAWDELPTITAATLILHGTDDRMVPVDNAQLIASRIAQSQVHLSHGGRHGFFDEFADLVTPRIRAFLRTADAQ